MKKKSCAYFQILKKLLNLKSYPIFGEFSFFQLIFLSRRKQETDLVRILKNNTFSNYFLIKYFLNLGPGILAVVIVVVIVL